jgi:hypothetical protein
MGLKLVPEFGLIVLHKLLRRSAFDSHVTHGFGGQPEVVLGDPGGSWYCLVGTGVRVKTVV